MPSVAPPKLWSSPPAPAARPARALLVDVFVIAGLAGLLFGASDGRRRVERQAPSFALYPWMTVTENVAIVLEAGGISGPERRERVRKVLALVGLSGFEEAIPASSPAG